MKLNHLPPLICLYKPFIINDKTTHKTKTTSRDIFKKLITKAPIMEYYTLSLLLIITGLLSSLSAAAATPNSFILNSCKPTTYPRLCADSLSLYASIVRRSHRQLAYAAVSVSASRAREASTYVTRLSLITGRSSAIQAEPTLPTLAFGDCVTTMSDSAEMLRKASQQLRHMGRARRPSFALRLSNVQTWLSAAITDQSMCLLSLQMEEEDQKSTAGSRMHLVTRKKVMEVSRVTSNALALVNQLGSRS